MNKIDVSRSTVVKSTTKNFELIKALFKANGVDSEWPNNKLALQQVSEMDIAGTDESGMFFVGMFYPRDAVITIQQLAFESLAAPESATMIIRDAEGDYAWLDHNGPITNVKVIGSGLEFYRATEHVLNNSEVVLRKEVKKKAEPDDKITEAVKHFEGIWPYGNKEGMVRAVRDVGGVCSAGAYNDWPCNTGLGLNTRDWEFICGREEFEKKAFELGYVKEVKAKQEPSQYRKLSGLKQWEIVKRWEEQNDLYSHTSIKPYGFSKIRHIQQLAQMINQNKVYEQCDERELFADKLLSVMCNLSDEHINEMWDLGLRFVGEV